MKLAALILIALIGVIHCYIAWIEIFEWETRGPEIFTFLKAELFPKTAGMAANQGIYNAFLAAGLFWSLMIKDRTWQRNVAVCFLLFVFVAGVFGAATVMIKTFYIQSVPALIALALLYFSARSTRVN